MHTTRGGGPDGHAAGVPRDGRVGLPQADRRSSSVGLVLICQPAGRLGLRRYAAGAVPACGDQCWGGGRADAVAGASGPKGRALIWKTNPRIMLAMSSSQAGCRLAESEPVAEGLVHEQVVTGDAKDLGEPDHRVGRRGGAAGLIAADLRAPERGRRRGSRRGLPGPGASTAAVPGPAGTCCVLSLMVQGRAPCRICPRVRQAGLVCAAHHGAGSLRAA